MTTTETKYRVSLIGPGPDGGELMSDETFTALASAHQHAEAFAREAAENAGDFADWKTVVYREDTGERITERLIYSLLLSQWARAEKEWAQTGIIPMWFQRALFADARRVKYPGGDCYVIKGDNGGIERIVDFPDNGEAEFFDPGNFAVMIRDEAERMGEDWEDRTDDLARLCNEIVGGE